MKIAAALLFAVAAEAHITLWHPSLFGFNHPRRADQEPQNYNTNHMVVPLRKMDNLTYEEWFAHGARQLYPQPDQFLELEVGKANTYELACNRAFTTYGNPNDKNPKHQFACRDDTGPLHNANKIDTPYDKLNMSWFGGTALGIAYTSDEWNVKPEDFTIISTNFTSPWYRLVDYQIPKDLPPCPPQGCLCSWNWFHTRLNGEGYGDEFYNTLYRCKVTGDTDGNRRNEVAKGVVPVRCDDNPDNCIKGPKQGMFLWMMAGNNMENPKGQSPTYNERYGFTDGAQEGVVQLNVKADSSGSGVASMVPSIAAVGGAAVCGLAGVLVV